MYFSYKNLGEVEVRSRWSGIWFSLLAVPRKPLGVYGHAQHFGLKDFIINMNLLQSNYFRLTVIIVHNWWRCVFVSIIRYKNAILNRGSQVLK